MICKTFEPGFLESYKYVVVLSFYEGNILLSRHKDRSTWETQGGHIEPGETPEQAARRELYEESGAADYEMELVCDYRAEHEDTGRGANGVVFRADIRTLGPLPPSEMAQVRSFAHLPENLTYPQITPVLFRHIGVE